MIEPPAVRCLRGGCDEVSPDYQEDEIHAVEKHWDRGSQAEAAVDYVRCRRAISEGLNPPDDDADEASILIAAVGAAVEYLDSLPCTCSPAMVEDHEACRRCFVLGRLADRRRQR